ncbi:MAG: hypothetical protein AABY34_06835 [Pseudomonadota bacterium]
MLEWHLPETEINHLENDILFKKLGGLANAMTDNEAAEHMQKQCRLLFKHLLLSSSWSALERFRYKLNQ